MLTNFDFLYDDEAEDVPWGPEYEDRRLSYCSLDVGSLDRDMKANLQTLECLSGSEQDLTPHDSSDDEDEVLGQFLFVHIDIAHQYHQSKEIKIEENLFGRLR